MDSSANSKYETLSKFIENEENKIEQQSFNSEERYLWTY